MGLLKNIILAFLMATLFLSLTGDVGNAATRILVMGEDSNPRSIARGDNVFKRVLGELKNSMLRKGYTLVDEEMIATSLEWVITQRRPKGELIEVAKMANQSDDASLHVRALAIFSIYAEIKKMRFTHKIHTRLEGELYDAVSNNFLGSFELPKSTYPAPKSCDKTCINEVVGEKAREIATSLGSVLAKKLRVIERSSKVAGSAAGSGGLKTTYTITIKHFSTSKSLKLLKALKKAPGYSSHETMSKASGIRRYSYESSSSASDLEEVILEALMELEVDVDKDLDLNIKGSKIIIENLAME